VFVSATAGKRCVSVCIAAVANTVNVIDPTKVVRVALENAVSVVSVLLLTEAMLTEIPEEKKSRLPGMEPESESME